MKKLVFIITQLISVFTFSQIKGVIIDKNTNEGIPYVNIWVVNENIGTTSSLKGEFEIDNTKGDSLVLSALGYETKKISLLKIPSKIVLIPKALELEEIVVSAKREKKENIIGSFDNDDIQFYYASDNKPEIKARLFPYYSTYSETPFLQAIKLRIYSDVRNAKFNIRCYSVGENGAPDKLIHDKNIIGIVKKKTENVELDLSNLDIIFPESGLFISYEWLIIKENEIELSFPIKDSKKRENRILYEPKVGLLPIAENTNSWIYKDGKWEKVKKFEGNVSKPYRDNFGVLAIELKLSD